MKINARILMPGVITAWLSIIGVAHAQTTIVWQDDFEVGDPTDTWNVDNSVWQFGAPLTGPATNSAGWRAHQGTNCAATILNGNYPASTSSRMAFFVPYVVPTTNENPRLQFWQWYQFSGGSYGVVQIKIGAGGAWTELSPRYYNTGSGVWTRPVVDLKAYAGKLVYIAFQIVADGNVADGWCVDEVRIVTGDCQTLTPNVAEGFELGLGDWSAETGTWEVGRPTWKFTAYAGIDHNSGTFYPLSTPAPDGSQAAFLQNVYGLTPSISQSLNFPTAGTYSITFACIGRSGGNGPNDLEVRIDDSVVYTLNHTNQSQTVWQTKIATYNCTAPGVHTLSFMGTRTGGDYRSAIDQVSVTGPGSVTVLDPSFEGTSISGYAYRPGGSSPGGAHSGTNCAATVLGGEYGPYADSRLISPPFVVPTVDQLPRLRFWHWFETQLNGDYCSVQVREVGSNTWTTLETYNYTSGGMWTRPLLDLKDYAGKSIQLAFRLTSDAPGYEAAGWYLDEVMVETGPRTVTWPEGFESGWGNWYTDNGTWEVGMPSWSFVAYAGIDHNSGTFYPLSTPAPDGNQSAVIVNANGLTPSISQSLNFPTTGTYSITFACIGRAGGYGPNDLQVQVDGNVVYTLNHTNQSQAAWQTKTATYNCTTPGIHMLSFVGTRIGGSFSSAIDQVSVTGPASVKVVDPSFETPSISGYVYQPGGSSPGGAHSGTNCAATILGATYGPYADSRLISPPFTVASSGHHPMLRFWHWFETQAGADVCYLEIREVGAQQWTELGHYSGTSGGVWSRPAFDISLWSGKTVQVAFRLISDAPGVEDAGWYVDDVVVTSVDPPTGIVEFTDARYFVNEGAGTVTITVARKNGSTGAATAYCEASDGTATSPGDFTAVVPALTWTNGESGVKSFTVPIVQDSLVEGNETVSLTLIVVPGALDSLAARETATLVIIDDDVVPPPLSTNIAYLRSLVGTANYVPTNTTSLFTVEGIVTTYINLSTTTADELFFMQDDTNGIAVLFRNGTNQFMPQAGDRLRITAALTHINGLLALAPNFANITNVVWRLSASNTLPTPAALDFASRTNVPVMEATEARYVSAEQVWINQAGGGTFPTVLTNLVMTNQSGQTFSLTINPNTDLAGKPKPAGPVTILGVLNQNDSTAPYTTNYALLPTRYADIITAPTITGQPQSRTNGVGTTAIFTVTAVGTDPLYYQWRKGGANVPISGATSNMLTLVNVQLADATNYSVVVTNYLGTVTSSNATLTVVVPVSITTHPQSRTNDTGTDVTFSVEVAGSSPFTYQWYWNTNTLLPNATNAVLNLISVQVNWAGTYHVVVDNAANLPTNSSYAVLTVDQVLVPDPVPPGTNGFGWFTKTNNVYTVTGGGEDIEGTEDRFFFAHLPWTGDGEIMAKVNFGTNPPPPDAQSEAGLMFRDGMAGGARHVFMAVDAGQNTVFRRRLAENAYSVENGYRGTNNVWLKLMRMGDTFIGHYSTNGVNWELVWWTTQPNLPATLDVGLAVTAHLNGSYATASFELVGPRGLTSLSGTRPHIIQLGGELGGRSEFQRVGGFKMLVDGTVGAAYNIKVSPTANAPFSSWSLLGTVTNTYGVVPFVDAQALTNGNRFYRGQKVGP